MRELIRKQWFVIALAGALILAFQFPEWGSSEGKLHSEIVSKIGIVLVFLFSGLVSAFGGPGQMHAAVEGPFIYSDFYLPGFSCSDSHWRFFLGQAYA
ncbi:MAG: bile acid:sodium symporter [Verrucomicrobia bacterium]|nr:bile acid:sodium symporter [Verrucomicrobiota bacterium]